VIAAAGSSLSQLTLNFNQRWCGGRASYRPPTEVIRTAEYEVIEIPDDNTARDFVTTHHYSRTFPSARFRIGLYRHGDLVGVAVFSHPCSNAVLTKVFFFFCYSSRPLRVYISEFQWRLSRKRNRAYASNPSGWPGLFRSNRTEDSRRRAWVAICSVNERSRLLEQHQCRKIQVRSPRINPGACVSEP